MIEIQKDFVKVLRGLVIAISLVYAIVVEALQ
jgi:hypothetical protein